ncbi:MAG: hypothetical protein GAK35_02212 [Herbaspirillum frisingense]|uniref:Tail tubular protein B n=1 Tax=Herbaspirillum frisingense TaxID=92645 RepID=A0A7V8FWK5_9BURK|nr:MAG: hypothetical protein GAK35_02212 [Herbaspirillum frisingense]
MSKVVSSYQSVVRGVSEQVAQDRHSGQHSEQVNMVSDPVTGVARRHGSIMMDEKLALSGKLTASQIDYARNYREYSFYIKGTEYSIVYMSAERNSADTLPFCAVLNKDTGKFLTVNYTDKQALLPWTHGGISALTTVGQFVVMASNSLGPDYTITDNIKPLADHGVAWVRGGAYSRTFTLKLTRASDGKAFKATYTTLSSSYPNLLDTSDVPLYLDAPTNTNLNKDYQKTVNDRVNAYNSAVNKWIGDAAVSVQPQNIAAKLAKALKTAGFTTVSTAGGSICLKDCSSLSVDDAGDGTLFRAVLGQLDDPAKVSSIHYPGKVVQIKTNGSSTMYYLKAVPDDPSVKDWQTVTWEEAAAQTVTPTVAFATLAISADGQNAWIGQNAKALNDVDATWNVPGYVPSTVGDIEAVGQIPYFFGKRVTLLTSFMDRLVIVSNGVTFMSRVGDYFNFFRKSMLTVEDDDPIEAYALGAEDDIISKCVTYNKDLFMFGQRKQYTISGRAVLTPKTVAVTTTASERDSMYAQPTVVGNLIYYGKYSPQANINGPSPYVGQIDQFQLGYFQDTPETYRVSQQLTRYIRGRPIELVSISSPATLFVRTDGNDFGCYVYSFIDAPGSQQRQFDAWYRWEWSENVGRIVGITSYKSTMFAFLLRTDGTDTYFACDQFVMDSSLSAFPYLDAMRSADHLSTGTIIAAKPDTFMDVATAIDATQDEFLLGSEFAEYGAFRDDYPTIPDSAFWTGFQYDAYVDLTPPFVRDQNDRAIVNGRLVVNRYSVSVTETAGLDAFLTAVSTTKQVLSFNGRRVGRSNNVVGRQPVTTTSLNVPAGRANTEHSLRLQARLWFPMTISAIEWVGQFFNNARRV